MSDYQAVDLSVHTNAGPDVIRSRSTPVVGDVFFRGIPFSIGAKGAEHPYVLFGAGGMEAPVHLAFDRPARTILVAHLLLESQAPTNRPFGSQVAEYVVELEGGERIVLPVREDFDISALVPPETPEDEALGWYAMDAFLAPWNQAPDLMARRSGPWEQTGYRQTEVAGSATDYRLWWWRDTEGRRAQGLVIRPASRPFLVAGVTIGDLDEDPVVRTAREPVRIDVLNGPSSNDADDLELIVDRGVATYVWPILPEATEVPGWGQPPAGDTRYYAEVAATPSATLEVRRGDAVLGRVRWGDLIDKGIAQDPGKVRLEWVDRARQWVHTTVVDEATNRPISCRIHFRSAAGIPWQPHGHHSHVNSDMPSWHIDVGGDVRLGAVSYAVIDGHCQGWLPVGDVMVEVVRGFEYEPLRTTVRIQPGQRELELRINRWSDVRKEGWYSGDTHVHFLGVSGAHLEARAEDLAVVNLLQAQWGQLFTNTEDFTGQPSVSASGDTIVFVGQENRQHILGHMGILGPREPVMPWSSDGSFEAELGGAMEVTLSDWADEGRRKGAMITLPHFGFPNGEAAALIATGRVDAVEMILLSEYFHSEYYRYLNAGYRLPLVGGTDKMSNEVPVGIYRTYARLDGDMHLTFDAWAGAVKSGRTFLSGGPILSLRVDGADVGDTIQMGGGGGTVELEATAESAEPFGSLQVVAGGRVVAEALAPTGTRRLEIRDAVKVPANSWIALRAGGPKYFDGRKQHDFFGRRAFAHTSPIYLRNGRSGDETTDEATLQYLLTRLEAGRSYVASRAPTSRLGGGGHPHIDPDHVSHLLRPFDEAQASLLRRRRTN
jgi:hypothetical protein